MSDRATASTSSPEVSRWKPPTMMGVRSSSLRRWHCEEAAVAVATAFVSRRSCSFCPCDPRLEFAATAVVLLALLSHPVREHACNCFDLVLEESFCLPNLVLCNRRRYFEASESIAHLFQSRRFHEVDLVVPCHGASCASGQTLQYFRPFPA